MMNDKSVDGMSNIVPFGKHKGKSVAEMMADNQYVSWLNSQPWFAEKFTQIYNVVNQVSFGDAETPEHNALQAKFLNKDLCSRVVGLNRVANLNIEDLDVEFESSGWDVRIKVPSNYFYLLGNDPVSYYVEIKPFVGDDYPSILRQMKLNLRYRIGNKEWFIPPENCILYTQHIETKLVKSEDVIKIFNASGFDVFVDDSI